MEELIGDPFNDKLTEQVLSKGEKKARKTWTFDTEPVLVLHTTVSFMIYNLVQNFLIEKGCLVNLGYSEELCDAIVRKNADVEEFVEEEKAIQKFVGSIMVWASVFENVIPMVLVLLIGAWSDKYGRKIPMLFVLTGFIVQNIALLMCVFFKYTTGAWTVAFVTFALPSLTGGHGTFLMAIFSYAADKSSVEKKSVSSGIARTSLFFGLGLVLGLVSAGTVSHLNISFTQIFVIGTVMEGMSFVYVWYGIENLRDEKSVKGKSTMNMFKDLFSSKHPKDTISSVFTERPGNARIKLWVLLCSYMCIFAPTIGEYNVMYLFGRYKFNWSSAETASFLTYKMILTFFGNFISMALLTETLKMLDPAVGITCCLSGIIGRIVLASANTSFTMYIGAAVSILSSASIPVPRSLISQLVPSNEMGKVNSFLACFECIIPILYGPILTLFYTNTFEFFPGAFFLLSAFIMVPPVFAFAWIQSSEKKNVKAE